MADAIELEEMVVRFVADQSQYVKQVKEVQKVTQDAADTAKKATALASRPMQPIYTANFAAKRIVEDTGSKRYVDELGQVTNQLDKTTASQRQYSRAVQETTDKQSLFSKVAGGATQMFAPLLAGLSVAGVMSTVGKSVSLAAQSESIDITFQTIIGDGAKAKVVLDELRAFADWSPFNTGEVMEAGKMMMAMGTSADHVVDVMMTMGDVAGALNIPIKDLTYLMGTLQSVGRATTVDLNQFALRGIPIWKELAKQMFGDPAAVDKVRKAVEAGQVSFDVVDKAFKNMTSAGGMFYQGMEKQAKGLQGLWATFQSETENVLRTVGDVIIEQFSLKWVLDEVTGLTKAFKGFVIDVATQTKGLMTLKQFWIEVSYNAKKFVEWVKPLVPLLLVILGILNPFAGAVILLGVYWKEVTGAVTQFFKYVDPILRELKYTVINLATAIRDGLVSAWNWAATKLRGVIDYINRLWSSLGVNVNWSSVQEGIRDLIVFVEYAFSHIDRVADVTWKGMKYGAVAAFNFLLNNVFAAALVVAFPLILLGMSDNWKTMLVSMAAAAVGWAMNLDKLFKDVTIHIASSMASTFEKMLKQVMSGKFDAAELVKVWADLAPEITKQAVKLRESFKTNFTPDFRGVQVKGLDDLQAQLKKEFDSSVKDMGVDFAEFKKARNAKIFWQGLMDVGKEVFKAGGGPLSTAGEAGKKAGEDVAKGMTDAMKSNMHGFDAVLKGSLAEAVRTQEYLDYLHSLPGRKGFNPNLPPGAVPVDQWRPQTPATNPMGAANEGKDKVVELLTGIFISLTKMESKPPVMAGPAGL